MMLKRVMIMTNHEVIEKISRIKRVLLEENPTYYFLLVNLPIVYYPDKEGTAATNSRELSLYGGFMALTDKQALAVIRHELGHIVYKHPIRVYYLLKTYGESIAMICNLAADAIVNNRDLRHNPEDAEILPRWEQFWSREEIETKTLEWLVKKFLEKYGEKVSIVLGETGQDIKSPSAKGGNSGNGQVIQEGNDRLKGAKTPEELDKELDKIIGNALMQGKRAGCGHGDIEREILYGQYKRIINWRKHVYNRVVSFKARTYLQTWQKANRKNPSFAGSKRIGIVRIYACVDTSGSISKELLTSFYEELKGLVNLADELYIVYWNDGISKIDKVKSRHDLLASKPKGYGGTKFSEVAEYLYKKANTPYDIIIVFTDGDWFDTIKASNILKRLKAWKVLVTSNKIIDGFDDIIELPSGW